MSTIHIVKAHSENRAQQARIGKFINGSEIHQDHGETGSLVWKADHHPNSIILSAGYDWDICQEVDDEGRPSWITLRAYKTKEGV